MSIPIQELFSLNAEKLLLNRNIKYFREDGKDYAYLNRFVPVISFMELSDGMRRFLNDFDGEQTTNEIVVRHKLDSGIFDLLSFLRRNRILHQPELVQKYPEINTLNITFYPTNSCNLRCIYCYASAGESTPKQLDFAHAKIWIDHLLGNLSPEIMSVEVLFHGGGEPTVSFPLLKKIWNEVKKQCAEKGLHCSLRSITNGNFNRDVLEWFAEEKAGLAFSIDGTKEFNDRMRPSLDGKSSFDRAFSNIGELTSRGLKCAVRATVGSYNRDNLIAFVDTCREAGITSINLDKLYPFGRSDTIETETLTDDEYKETFIRVWDYSLRKGIPILGFSTMSLRLGRPFFCNNYEENSFAVTPEGYLSPCPEVSMLDDPAANTFFGGRINSEGKVEFFRERIKDLRERTTENLKICGECFLEYVCRGGCVVKSYRKNGELMSVEPERCDYIRGVSATLWKKLLAEPALVPERLKPEHYHYSPENHPELFADCLAYRPAR
ncbi:MAG: radical SAM protein [Ignavibacteriales bacterium]|nr:radical SAM protein [Ignavibacteriales bacterium]